MRIRMKAWSQNLRMIGSLLQYAPRKLCPNNVLQRGPFKSTAPCTILTIANPKWRVNLHTIIFPAVNSNSRFESHTILISHVYWHVHESVFGCDAAYSNCINVMQYWQSPLVPSHSIQSHSIQFLTENFRYGVSRFTQLCSANYVFCSSYVVVSNDSLCISAWLSKRLDHYCRWVGLIETRSNPLDVNLLSYSR